MVPRDDRVLRSATRQTRKEAIRAAIALVGKGIEGVTITDEDGQIYQTANFTSFFNKGSLTISSLRRSDRGLSVEHNA
jgi:hypothetical protein